jgi:predicted RNA-binding Zn-ribbon protein involved in translation (DUF1610 family)
MQRAHLAQLACTNCFSLMDQVDEVPVLASLAGQAVFACQSCGHVTLVRDAMPLRTAIWAGSLPTEGAVSFAAL